MKWIILMLFVSTSLIADDSVVFPVLKDAVEIYETQDTSKMNLNVLKPELRAVIKVLENNNIDPGILRQRLGYQSKTLKLERDDQFDGWIKNLKNNSEPTQLTEESPMLALHAFKFDVIQESDSWFKDDIYVYYFITDGMIPTGKVSSIYKGLNGGDSFFFNFVDRSLFPLQGSVAKKVSSHLIVDYGIIESDGDDIKEMQKISSVIIDIALAVYTSYDPQRAPVIVNLRKEIKALSDLLLNLNNDDRMSTGSFGHKASELAALLKDQPYVEFKKNHAGKAKSKNWNYDLWFRLIKE